MRIKCRWSDDFRTNVAKIIKIIYRDRRVERQSRWPEALFRRLAILALSYFVPLEIRPIIGMHNLRHSSFGGLLSLWNYNIDLKKKVFRSNILLLLFHMFWQYNIYRKTKMRSILDQSFLENRIRIRSISDIFCLACHRIKANLRYIAPPHFLVIFGDLRLPSLLCPKIIIKNKKK